MVSVDVLRHKQLLFQGHPFDITDRMHVYFSNRHNNNSQFRLVFILKVYYPAKMNRETEFILYSI